MLKNIDINNNVIHQLYLILITFIFGTSFLFYLHLNNINEINNIYNKLENSIIKNKLLDNINSLNKRLLLNGGDYLESYTLYNYFIDTNNDTLDFILKKDFISKNNLDNIKNENNLYYSTLKERLEQKKYQSNLNYIVSIFIIFSITISTLFFIFIKIRNNQNELKTLNENLEKNVLQKTKELHFINKNLEMKILSEININREKDKYLIEQSRFIALGEMISNIAHQWRQPLNSISLFIQKITCADLLNETLTKEELNDIEKGITNQLTYMSNTIDIFQNFYNKNKKDIELFNISNTIKNTLTILGPMLLKNSIKLNLQIKYSCSLKGIENELIQVLMNLISNSKDVFEERNIENKMINININKKDNNCIIKISDNGGGINQNIIEKIFDPYFTTKHQSRGTGLGLYMSRVIITKDFDGQIKVENIENGVEFIITLPIKD